MNSNSKSHKSSSIFIAAVLVAGLIAIASPSYAFAEEDDYKEYNEYESYDQPYKQEKKYEKQDGGYNTAECSVSNFNIGEVTDIDAQLVNNWLTQTENNALSSDANINSIEQMDGSNGIGSNDAGLEFDFENICLNFGDNENFGTVGSVP